MKFQHLYSFIVAYHSLCAAIPYGRSNRAPLRRGLEIRATTVQSDGSVIDWISRDSQVQNGSIASPPPKAPTTFQTTDSNWTTLAPKALLQEPGSQLGPEGTVPILRPKAQLPTKGPLPGTGSELGTEAVGDHWYASSSQSVTNMGGSASYSLYKAFVQADSDFSLLQTAVIRDGVPKPGDNSQSVGQTLEAGWINYPDQIAAPHLFTYFTTDGYASNADYKGGWNRDVAGWVQVDDTIFPGTTFSPLSTRGGDQYALKISYLLYEGNWWLYVSDRWIGYYPASMFGADTDASRSLQVQASGIFYYGEIYDSHPEYTTTDMGSGAWPEAGFGQSAFIQDMVYTDLNGNDQRYEGSDGIVISDSNRYRMDAEFDSQTTWNSYMFLGGPGAGGQIDA